MVSETTIIDLYRRYFPKVSKKNLTLWDTWQEKFPGAESFKTLTFPSRFFISNTSESKVEIILFFQSPFLQVHQSIFFRLP